MKQLQYQFFGSKDSQDLDVVFFVSSMPETIQEKLYLAKSYSETIAKDFPEKAINTNLAMLKNGHISKVYKGTVDELNNALFYTYDFHQQKFENQIQKTLKRDIDLKFLRSSRMILSFLSKTEYRMNIKESLRNNIHSKINALKNIDFTTLTDFGKGSNSQDILKSITFQIGQCLALDQGKELYSKIEIANFIPELHDFLYRKENSSLIILQNQISKFIEILEERAKNMKLLEEYNYEDVNSF